MTTENKSTLWKTLNTEKAGQKPFLWPTPPFASYPGLSEQTESLPCEVEGTNGVHTAARLTFFVPEESVAHIQIPPSRTTIPLRFNHFRSLTITAPLHPADSLKKDTHADVLSKRTVNSYRLSLVNGGVLHGQTVGHVETKYGLFLFPPVDETGSVYRMFIPKDVIKNSEIGPRIGEVLIEQRSVTASQVEQGIDTQMGLRQQKIGDILLSQQVVTKSQLLEALERQASLPMIKIGEALISMGAVTELQLNEALVQQDKGKEVPLGELLVSLGLVSKDDLQAALARKMGFPLVNVDQFPFEEAALQKLSFHDAKRLEVLPLLLREGKLVIAVGDPVRRHEVVNQVEFITQLKVVPALAQAKALDTAIFNAYDKISAAKEHAPVGREEENTEQLVEALTRANTEDPIIEDEKPILQSDSSLVRLINSIIIDAHSQGASDIHIESYPGREKIRVRFRKDGSLKLYLELPPHYRNALIARIKIMCDLDISEKRKPQDGKIQFAKFSPAHKIELRTATIPTNNGMEDVVLRILASAKPIPLDRIGLSDRNLKELREAVDRPYGMVLCVGPTGSGKTTTLHSALSHINVPERKIWTAEDPVEITQPGLRQVQVNAKIDWTFAKALRAFLRADPDVIMVGEVRDKETANMAVEASLTGHLVMSTLHTNSAPETVTRLLDMGLDPFNFADALLGILAQRLVRRICGSCVESKPATDEEVNELLADYMHAFGANAPITPEEVRADWVHQYGRLGTIHRFHAKGCEKCGHTGFKGRLGLHEVMIVSRNLRRMIQNGARAEELQHQSLQEGMRTLRQDGIEKILAGLTTIEEVRATSNA